MPQTYNKLGNSSWETCIGGTTGVTGFQCHWRGYFATELFDAFTLTTVWYSGSSLGGLQRIMVSVISVTLQISSPTVTLYKSALTPRNRSSPFN